MLTGGNYEFVWSLWNNTYITLPQEEHKDKHYDEIVAYYHTEFVGMLKTMGFLKPPPSLLDLHIELLRYGVLASIISICFIPHILICGSLTEEDWNTNPIDEGFKKNIFENKDFQRIVIKELERLLRKGFVWLYACEII